jgi:LL-H family phage holin
MQMDEFTMLILKIVISVCAALITYYVIPYIKALREDARWSSVIEIVEIAVRAAEQAIKGSGQGALKKAEVLSVVTDWLKKHGIELTEDELDQIIEASVYVMKQEG